MKILFSQKPRDCNFSGYLTGWRRYEQYVRTGWCAPLGKWFFYVYVPALQRQLCLDVWFESAQRRGAKGWQT